MVQGITQHLQMAVQAALVVALEHQETLRKLEVLQLKEVELDRQDTETQVETQQAVLTQVAVVALVALVGHQEVALVALVNHIQFQVHLFFMLVAVAVVV